MFLPSKQPDQNVFSASFELQGENGKLLYASASFSPIGEAACSATYDGVEYSAQPCAEVQKSTFPTLKPQGALRKDIAMLSAGTLKVFLMPAGSGCVIIKKEVVR